LLCRFATNLESEIAELEEEEKAEFLEAVGMEEPGLNRVIRAGYGLLGYTPILPQVLKKSVHGRFPLAQLRLKVQVKFIPTLKKALFVPKSLPMMTLLNTTANKVQKTQVNGV
jgi:hypothetical protein